MGLNTYPYNPFPAGTDKLDEAHNEQIQAEIDLVKSELTNLDNAVNGDAITYPYADSITIEDAVPSNLADCSVKIEPVQSGSGDPSPTNIRPITGHTETSVQRDGKNLFDVSAVELHKSINDVGFVYTTDNYNLSDYIRVSGTKLIVSGDNKDKNISFGFYDENKTWFNFASVSVNTAVTIPNGTAYVRFDVYKDSENIQLELGSTATPYEPYQGKTYTIALGSTIYGGTVDFDSGVMTVDRAIVDLGTITWFYSSGDKRFYAWFSSVKRTDPGNIANIICDRYRTVSWYDYVTLDGVCASAYLDATYIGIRDLRYDNVSDFTTALNGAQLVYELATPTTIQLTPQQIQLIKGTNILTASTGQISVTVNGVSGAIGSVQEQVNELAEDVAELAEQLPNAPTTDGAYVLTVTVASSTPTYSWESAE